jgi:hypothetical protein
MRSRSSTNETVTTMELAQEYLQHAEQCEQQAADAQLESSRVALLTAAVIWRKLAVSPPGLPEKLGQRLLRRGIAGWCVPRR